VKFLHASPRKIYMIFSVLLTSKRTWLTDFFDFSSKRTGLKASPKRLLHGTGVAMYIVGQERRLVDPPSQVVAGVRTVTTNMDGRDALPRMSRPFAFSETFNFCPNAPA